MEPFFICSICQNQDPNKIGLRKGLPYCRACIMFSGEPTEKISRPSQQITPEIDYELTQEQRLLSGAILEAYKQKKHVLVDAVTGSGKTEIVFAVIQYALLLGHKVAFVIPRKDVVIEMVDRFSKVFPTLHIGAMYGGVQEKSDDFMVLTTHQIYHFQAYFDLIIFDEVDAFPYHGNPVLKALVNRASIGSIVYLSATFYREEMLTFQERGGVILHLYKRYHGYPLPELTILKANRWLKMYVLYLQIKKLYALKTPFIVFVPTIYIGETIAWWVLKLFKKGMWVHSKSDYRDQAVKAFKAKKLRYLISTSILERGITLAHLQVIIYASDHGLMDEKTIVQMAGRVGRKTISPKGQVILICEKISAAMEASQKRIRTANEAL